MNDIGPPGGGRLARLATVGDAAPDPPRQPGAHLGPAASPLGRLRGSAGLRDGVVALREIGSPDDLALGLLDQAEFLAGTGEAPVAEALADEARVIAEGLGARPLADRGRLASGAEEGLWTMNPPPLTGDRPWSNRAAPRISAALRPSRHSD